MTDATRPVRITYIGGPTALIEMGGLRLLTDPTFDPGESRYPTPVYTLHKLQGPAMAPEEIGPVDAVLLSHDHHFDNFDRAGRKLAMRSARILTTGDGAIRLGKPAIPLRPWEETTITAADGRVLRVTATPARHGPPDGDRGPVIGFVAAFDDAPDDAIYVSGDTVWYEGVAEVARRFPVRVALLHLGAARVKEVGGALLTFSAEEAVDAARAFPRATLVPLHYEGWAHFSEGRAVIAAALADARIESRVRWLEPGHATEV